MAMALGLLLLSAVLLHPASLRAQEPATDSGADAAEVVIPADLRAGLPVEILFDLKGYEIPPGSSAAVKVLVLKGPEGAEPTVKNGYPRTTITFHAPGEYRLGFLVNQFTKSSCGGLGAKLLLEEQRDLTVAE